MLSVDSLELVRPRSVGVEHVGLWAFATLGVLELLAELGLNGVQRAAVIGNGAVAVSCQQPAASCQGRGSVCAED